MMQQFYKPISGVLPETQQFYKPKARVALYLVSKLVGVTPTQPHTRKARGNNRHLRFPKLQELLLYHATTTTTGNKQQARDILK